MVLCRLYMDFAIIFKNECIIYLKSQEDHDGRQKEIVYEAVNVVRKALKKCELWIHMRYVQ